MRKRTGWKKNTCSYVLWLLYTLTAGTLLALIMVRTCVNAGYSVAVGVLAGICTLLGGGLVALLVYLFFYVFKKRGWRLFEGDRHKLLGEGLLLLVLLTAGVFARIWHLGDAGQETDYYNLAYVSAEDSVPRMAHGIVSLYVRLLHIVFFVLGNKLSAGAGAQIALQMLALVLFYLAIRRLTGRGAGILFLLFGLFSPSMIRDAVTLSPKGVFLALYGVILLVLSAVREREKPLFYCLCGMLIGILGELDALGITLLFLLVGSLLWRGEDDRMAARERDLAASGGLLGFLAAFAVCMALEAGYLERSFGAVWRLWLGTYQAGLFELPEILFTGGIEAAALVLIAILGVGIFGFWCSDTDYLSVWMLLAVPAGVALGGGFYSKEVPAETVMYLILSIMAGAGMSSMFTGRNKKHGSGFVSKEVLFQDAGEMETREEKREDTRMPEDGNAGIRKEPGGGLIENPLPVPKRHKKPMLDFDIDSMDGKNYYDVRVPDNDDFDI